MESYDITFSLAQTDLATKYDGQIIVYDPKKSTADIVSCVDVFAENRCYITLKRKSENVLHIETILNENTTSRMIYCALNLMKVRESNPPASWIATMERCKKIILNYDNQF